MKIEECEKKDSPKKNPVFWIPILKNWHLKLQIEMLEQYTCALYEIL